MMAQQMHRVLYPPQCSCLAQNYWQVILLHQRKPIGINGSCIGYLDVGDLVEVSGQDLYCSYTCTSTWIDIQIKGKWDTVPGYHLDCTWVCKVQILIASFAHLLGIMGRKILGTSLLPASMISSMQAWLAACKQVAQWI
jgi:hypothetical protein